MKIFKVRVKNSENELEVEGDKKYIDLMLKRFGFTGQQVQEPTHAEKSRSKKSAPPGLLTKMSPAEFVLQRQIKKHTNLVLGFGYYLEKSKGMDKFSPGDINNCYYEAKLDPSNTSQMIIQNIKGGYLMEAKGTSRASGGKKYYTVTQSGMHFVENGFKKYKKSE